MPDPKEAVTTAEQEATEAPVKSVREEVEDSLIESTEETAPAEQDKEAAGEETQETEQAQEEKTEETDEVDEMLREEEPEETPNVQKRIDRLSAELKAARAELETMRKEQPGKKAEEEPVYTPQQLRTALKKAMEDEDADLVMDIIDHRQMQLKKELVKMYSDEKEATIKQAKAIDDEWNQLVTAYDKYADTKVPEIWAGSRKDLSLRDATSLLYNTAMRLYWEEPGMIRGAYRGSGGQKLAVADALTYILRKKAGSKEGSKVKRLEKQLTKEKMKKSPVSGGPSGEEKLPRKPLTESERLDEVLSERRKFQEERGV
jgi:hypothetical protein